MLLPGLPKRVFPFKTAEVQAFQVASIIHIRMIPVLRDMLPEEPDIPFSRLMDTVKEVLNRKRSFPNRITEIL